MLGGALQAAGLLLCQELLQPARGEGESLTLELHQVGVLQPGLGEAVPGCRASPENGNENISTAQTGSESDAPPTQEDASPGVTAQHLFEEGRGALRHVWVKFARVKPRSQDLGLHLSGILIFEGKSPTEPV